jgi:hypothetical protein
VFLIQFYPSRKKRASTADFSYPITLIKPREIAIVRAGSPLHAESAAPTGVVALPEYLRLTQPPLQHAYLFPARV